MSGLDAMTVARAVVAAATIKGFDPTIVLQPPPPRRGPGDGRMNVRLLAAAGLVLAFDTPRPVAARLLASGPPANLTPSQLCSRRITADQVRQVADALLTGSLPPPPAPRPTRTPAPPREPKAKRPGPSPSRERIHPKRDLAREARIIKARQSGEGPGEIAAREKVALSHVDMVVRRGRAAGLTFPELPRGPRPSGAARQRAPRPSPPPRARPEPKAFAPPPPPPEPVEAFPEGHPAWAPLEGSEPVALRDADRGCRWPVTVANDGGGPHVCNALTRPGHPYCGQHLWKSLTPDGRKALGVRRPQPTVVRVARPAEAEDADADVRPLDEEAA